MSQTLHGTVNGTGFAGAETQNSPGTPLVSLSVDVSESRAASSRTTRTQTPLHSSASSVSGNRARKILPDKAEKAHVSAASSDVNSTAIAPSVAVCGGGGCGGGFNNDGAAGAGVGMRRSTPAFFGTTPIVMTAPPATRFATQTPSDIHSHGNSFNSRVVVTPSRRLKKYVETMYKDASQATPSNYGQPLTPATRSGTEKIKEKVSSRESKQFSARETLGSRSRHESRDVPTTTQDLAVTSAIEASNGPKIPIGEIPRTVESRESANVPVQRSKPVTPFATPRATARPVCANHDERSIQNGADFSLTASSEEVENLIGEGVQNVTNDACGEKICNAAAEYRGDTGAVENKEHCDGGDEGAQESFIFQNKMERSVSDHVLVQSEKPENNDSDGEIGEAETHEAEIVNSTRPSSHLYSSTPIIGVPVRDCANEPATSATNANCRGTDTNGFEENRAAERSLSASPQRHSSPPPPPQPPSSTFKHPYVYITGIETSQPLIYKVERTQADRIIHLTPLSIVGCETETVFRNINGIAVEKMLNGCRFESRSNSEKYQLVARAEPDGRVTVWKTYRDMRSSNGSPLPGSVHFASSIEDIEEKLRFVPVPFAKNEWRFVWRT